MGAFNLVRTSAYRECGGYEALRLTVLDDVRLGLLLRRAGKRTRGFIGGSDVECHWGTTVRAMIKSWRELLRGDRFPARRSVGRGLGRHVVLVRRDHRTVYGDRGRRSRRVGDADLSVPAYILTRRLSWSGTSALLTPFVYPALFYAMLKSAWVTTRQGGVYWRNTFYSLDELRVGTVR